MPDTLHYVACSCTAPSELVGIIYFGCWAGTTQCVSTVPLTMRGFSTTSWTKMQLVGCGFLDKITVRYHWYTSLGKDPPRNAIFTNGLMPILPVRRAFKNAGSLNTAGDLYWSVTIQYWYVQTYSDILRILA